MYKPFLFCKSLLTNHKQNIIYIEEMFKQRML